MYREKQTDSNGNINIKTHDEKNGTLIETIREQNNLSNMTQMGYFGNVWVRSHYFAKSGDTNGGGHYHRFDHVTLLAVGSVEVEVEGNEPKIFHAPTFIVIPKDNKHKFTALTDGVVYYCVYALRDENGELTELYSGDNTPYNMLPDEEYAKLQQIKKFDKETTHDV